MELMSCLYADDIHETVDYIGSRSPPAVPWCFLPSSPSLHGILWRLVQRLGEGGDVTNLSPFWGKTAQKRPLPGTYLTNSPVKCDEFWHPFILPAPISACRLVLTTPRIGLILGGEQQSTAIRTDRLSSFLEDDVPSHTFAKNALALGNNRRPNESLPTKRCVPRSQKGAGA